VSGPERDERPPTQGPLSQSGNAAPGDYPNDPAPASRAKITSVTPADGWSLRAWRPDDADTPGWFVLWPVALWALVQCPGQADRFEPFIACGDELVPGSTYATPLFEEPTLVRSDQLCDCRHPRGLRGVDAVPGSLCQGCGHTVPRTWGQ